MKLWSFVFCQPGTLQSARVAAPDKAFACGLLAALIGVGLDLTQPRLGASVLAQYAGEVGVAEPAVLSIILADGTEVAA